MSALRFGGVSKHFAGITALDGVSFDVKAGECHAICGENGAGKSTLGKILAGIVAPDAGHVAIDRRPVRFASPRDALAAGVAMVHQELAFCDNLTVADNLCLGAIPRRGPFVDEQALHARARELLQAVGASIDTTRRMNALSVAEQQLVQIAAAVGEGARVIVFDEPTSSLGDAEAEALFRLIGELKRRGVTLLYVSHRMPEIFALCDAITVLRDGKHVATQPTSAVSEADLVQQMIGRRLDQYFPSHTSQARGEERLRVENLRGRVSFTLHAGEVLGIAGLVGAGRSEVAQAIFGLEHGVRGDVFVRGAKTRIRSPRDAMRFGIGFVPEDRKKQGLVLSMRCGENATLPIVERFAHAGWIDRDAESDAVATHFSRLNVKTPPSAAAGSLSGGNQQKIVISKWLATDADILMLDEPTRGVDVGTKAEIHAWIDQRAAAGAAVLFISSELPELLNVCSRIIVLRAGEIVGEMSREAATQDRVLRLMTGIAPIGQSGNRAIGQSGNRVIG